MVEEGRDSFMDYYGLEPSAAEKQAAELLQDTTHFQFILDISNLRRSSRAYHSLLQSILEVQYVSHRRSTAAV